jgi:hypothetical protein
MKNFVDSFQLFFQFTRTLTDLIDVKLNNVLTFSPSYLLFQEPLSLGILSMYFIN